MEDERLLPIANVGRIMRSILPGSAKISKEGKQIMQECASEFISFVTEEASDKCHKENRKTLNGDDICWALSALGFDNYAEAISCYLHKYRQSQSHKLINNHHLYPKTKPPPPPHLENSSSARRDKQQIVGRSCAEESSEKFRVSDDQEKAPDATDQSPS